MTRPHQERELQTHARLTDVAETSPACVEGRSGEDGNAGKWEDSLLDSQKFPSARRRSREDDRAQNGQEILSLHFANEMRRIEL